MNAIRAKFSCESVSMESWGEEVRLRAVWGGDSNSEDNTFAAATPNATVALTISNPSAQGFFVPGEKYYADFSKAPVEKAGL